MTTYKKIIRGTLIAAIILTVVNFNLLAQNWKDIKLDKNISLTLPGDTTHQDTLGKTIIFDQAFFGKIIITKIPQKNSDHIEIEKERQLKNLYTQISDQIKTSSKGEISDQEETKVDGLTAQKFVLRLENDGSKQLISNRVLYVNDAIYIFQYWQGDLENKDADKERERFFTSIKAVSDHSGQFTNNVVPKANTNNQYYIIGGVVIVILIIIFLIFRRKRIIKE